MSGLAISTIKNIKKNPDFVENQILKNKDMKWSNKIRKLIFRASIAQVLITKAKVKGTVCFNVRMFLRSFEPVSVSRKCLQNARNVYFNLDVVSDALEI